jgi:hypothetical protein
MIINIKFILVIVSLFPILLLAQSEPAQQNKNSFDFGSFLGEVLNNPRILERGFQEKINSMEKNVSQLQKSCEQATLEARKPILLAATLVSESLSNFYNQDALKIKLQAINKITSHKELNASQQQVIETFEAQIEKENSIQEMSSKLDSLTDNQKMQVKKSYEIFKAYDGSADTNTEIDLGGFFRKGGGNFKDRIKTVSKSVKVTTTNVIMGLREKRELTCQAADKAEKALIAERDGFRGLIKTLEDGGKKLEAALSTLSNDSSKFFELISHPDDQIRDKFMKTLDKITIGKSWFSKGISTEVEEVQTNATQIEFDLS